jgi:fatty-acyl-CoA synthase
MKATSTLNTLPLRKADFSNLAEALDYAARGMTGYNFYTGKGELASVLPYRELRLQAQVLARRLGGLGLDRGARVALIAETHPDFMRFFFACQYAGLVPVPLPVPFSLGSREAYVKQLRRQLDIAQVAVAVATEAYMPLLREAATGSSVVFAGTPSMVDRLPESSSELEPLGPEELAYLQYTSGSTQFPRGVMITQRQVMSNLAGIVRDGVKTTERDRCASWLPYYHDMGLVGMVLAPMASQRSVDYMGPKEFAMRPQQWLRLIVRNEATISFGPPFAYGLVAQRLRDRDLDELDLSSWRVAGVGAEPIRPSLLDAFARALAPNGFDPRAFLPSYGMAEASLAVSFPALGTGVEVDRIDGDYHAETRVARPIAADAETDGRRHVSEFVSCGAVLPDHEVEIRDADGRILPERHTGVIFLRGPSVMSGYFSDPGATAASLSEDGWLDTGDLGYRVGANLYITGRRKDMIIVNGRNIWPQDLEYIAESEPGIRTADALAFSAPGPDGREMPVMMVQCRETEAEEQSALVGRLQGRIYEELAIECRVELVPPHSLPHTSSGKRSRSKARQIFIAASEARKTTERQRVAA